MDKELNFTLRSAESTSPEALMLTKELYFELEELYGAGTIEEFEEGNKSFLYFIIIFNQKDHPAGCGALKYFDPFTIEIKRMYVRKEFRGKGLSKLILSELEKKAKEMRFSRIVLGTGAKQPEALNLYQKSGYTRREAFGIYSDDHESICWEKEI